MNALLKVVKFLVEKNSPFEPYFFAQKAFSDLHGNTPHQ
jgi:hypothetical protein